MSRPRIGLLPFYLELYDRAMPDRRPKMEQFYGLIADQLQARGLEVLRTSLCRLRREFMLAVAAFEQAEADAMVTLHLAYSPSLESADALAAARLPVVVLDTTPTYDFGPSQDPDQIMYNHGVHGVQDMCNVLRRNGKPFHIEAGHWKESDVLDRVASRARSARLARKMRGRVGRIGEAFAGMGDFAVPSEKLQAALGVQTVPADPALIRDLLPPADAAEVEAEMAADRAAFVTEGLSRETHRRTAAACLAVRRWIEREHLTAFTMNFLAVTRASGLPAAPFLEASKAMARGLGYAGEGDVLTASLVGALAAVYPDTTFTEIFCPDWKNNSVFLSHMGEMNLNLAASRPRLTERPFPWTDADNPAVALACLRPGPATLVNLAPDRDDRYSLVIAPVEMLAVQGEDRMSGSIRGWFRPRLPVADFLAAYSRAGGTHHSALVYGDVADEAAVFADFMGWNTAMLR
jgi:L-arabinose isomerase